MTRPTDIDLALLRLLHGEMPPDEARELRARIAREPALAAAYGRLEQSWGRLDLPPPTAPPHGFTGRVMSRVRDRSAEVSWTAAPAWVRAAAAAALLAGVALGAGIGSRGFQGPAEPYGDEDGVEFVADSDSLSLAESYWTAFEDSEAAP